MRKKLLLTVIISSLLLTACSNDSASSDTSTTADVSSTTAATNASDSTTASDDAVVAEGTIIETEFTSDAIAQNVIGETSTRKLEIYLPASYEGSDKNYPVVYFLHGYGDSISYFIKDVAPDLDKAFQNSDKEFILVAFDGNISTGGSFYVNSPVSGNWEDFETQELINYMDTNYRTIADSSARSITGYSMGGFGALYLGLRHPDIYSSILVFCPGIFADGDLSAMWDSWNGWTDVKTSYAQAFSPNAEDTVNYGNIPVFDDSEADNKVVEQWIDGYGNLSKKVDEYLALDNQLKSIQINYSNEDNFPWIPAGCISLSNILTANDINNSINQFSGGHIVPEDSVENYFVPFMNENLSFE